MPYTAHSADEDDLVFVAQADAEAEFNCIWCPEPVSYVRAHTRNGTDKAVDAHFRYYNCTHGTVDELADNDGGGGGGGGGESLIHRRRKAAAMQEALNRFDSTDYDTERQIGSKRADAVVVFEEPHQEYGKGLVIEYQHKNEGKDIPATEKHFARHEYTTVWLWEEQFDLSSSVPDIDLFGGRVYTPWPDAVPEQDRWRGEGLAQKKSRQWSNAHDDDLTESSVPATLPDDFFDKKSLEIWRRQEWDSLFTGCQTDKHRLRAAIPSAPKSQMSKPTLPKKLILPHPADLWSKTDWHERFTGTCEIPTTNSDTSPTATIPFLTWVSEKPSSDYWVSLKNAHESGLKDWGKLLSEIPTPSEWAGVEEFNPPEPAPSIEVLLPLDYFEKHRDTLEFHRDLGAGELDLHLAYELSENNAPRRCSDCGEEADYYLFKDNELSTFKCRIHNQFISKPL